MRERESFHEVDPGEGQRLDPIRLRAGLRTGRFGYSRFLGLSALWAARARSSAALAP